MFLGVQKSPAYGAGIQNGLTPEQVQALGLAPVYFANDPATGTYSAPAGVSTSTGWMIVTAILGAVAGTNQYLCTLHDGSISNIMGMRINTSNKATFYNQVGGTNKAASSFGYYTQKQGKLVTYGVSWNSDGYQFFTSLEGNSQSLYGTKQDFNDETITMPRAATVTSMGIGCRNGGLDTFNGKILAVEIGNVYLTEPQLTARMLQMTPRPLTICTIGQSLMKQFCTNEDTQLSEGKEAFDAQLHSAFGGYSPGSVNVLNFARGGASLMRANESTGSYWWDETTQSPGPNLVTMEAQLKRLGRNPDVIFYSGHETDSSQIDTAGKPTLAEYKTAKRAFLAYIHRKWPQTLVLIQGLGRRTTSTGTMKGCQKIREFQSELVADTPYVRFLAHAYDLPLYDDVHNTAAGCATLGTRIANRVAYFLGKSQTGTLGPRVVSAVRSGTTVTVTLAHDAGTDFTPTAATTIQGFKYFDGNGNEIAITNPLRASATTITMTLASAVAGTLYYVYDGALDITDTTRVVKDNATVSMPLHPFRLSVA